MSVVHSDFFSLTQTVMNRCGLLQSEKATNGHNLYCFCGLHRETLMILSMASSRGLELREKFSSEDEPGGQRQTERYTFLCDAVFLGSLSVFQSDSRITSTFNQP